MIASDPCPNCGSSDIRWRRRRIYDVVLTWIRYALDSALGTFFDPTGSSLPTHVGGASSEEISGANWAGSRPDVFRYPAKRQSFEERVGTLTAVRFWKCRTCRKRGEVFEDPTDLIGTA